MNVPVLAVCVIMFAAASAVEAQIAYPVDFRASVLTSGTKRNVSLDNTVTGRLDAAVTGFEASVSPASGGGGIGGRILQGNFGADSFLMREARVFIGDKAFFIEGAYGERSLLGSDSTALFSRAGIRSTIPIGGSGVWLSVSGAKYFQGDFSKKDAASPEKADGWEGETAILYATPRFPAFLRFGYRTEYFEIGAREEHMSGLVLGLGLWLGGR